jgi:hypothetical protein
MARAERDVGMSALRGELEVLVPTSRFPLDAAVECIRRIQQQRGPAGQQRLGSLLNLFEATSVSAALAIKRLGGKADDISGIRDALVDLWARAEAARSLVFDVDTVWSGAERNVRQGDLWETARLLAPDAIAIAMRLSEPVSQYVEFASKVIEQEGPAAG